MVAIIRTNTAEALVDIMVQTLVAATLVELLASAWAQNGHRNSDIRNIIIITDEIFIEFFTKKQKKTRSNRNRNGSRTQNVIFLLII